MENIKLDSILLAIGLFVSFYFHWQQHKREKRREKIDISEFKKSQKKQARIQVSNFNCWSVETAGVNNQICESKVTITNIGNAPIYILKVSIDFNKNLPKEVHPQISEPFGEKNPICIEKGKTTEYKIRLKAVTSNYSLKSKLSLLEISAELIDLEGMVIRTEFEKINCIDVDSPLLNF